MRPLLVLFALLSASCGGAPCCEWSVKVARDTRYVGTLPSTDGGLPTRMELVLTSTDQANLSFTDGTRTVRATFAATRR